MKVINNIYPFNDLFYINCFYNCLFPVIQHYDGNILEIIVNDVIIYESFRENNFDFVRVEYLPKEDIYSILANMGITVKTSSYSKSFIDNVVNAVTENKPVILCVDPFYEPIREDTYEKKHDKHSLLIYGYDRQKNIFNIIEQKHRDTLSYQKCFISFNDLENAHSSYCMNCNKSEMYPFPVYQEYSCNGSQRKNRKNLYYKEIFLNNMREKKNEIFDSIKKMKIYIAELKEALKDAKRLEILIEGIIGSLNSVINAKNVELFKLTKLNCTEDKIFKLQRECTDLWILLRSKLLRYMFTKRYNIELYVENARVLDRIFELETYYIECITKSM